MTTAMHLMSTPLPTPNPWEIDGGYRQPKQEGDKISSTFLCIVWKKLSERPNVGRVLLGVGAVLRLHRGAWSMVTLLRQATNECPSPSRPPPFSG